MAIWDRLIGLIAGGAIARSASKAVDPVLETAAQQAWGQRAVRVLTPKDAALAEVKGFPSEVDFADDAKRSGIGAARYDALKHLAYTFPGPGALDDLTNRDLISDGDARAALERLGYTKTYIDALVAAFQDLLSPAEVAAAVQQGHLANAGILPDLDPAISPPPGYKQPPAPDGAKPTHVPLTQIDLGPIKEAAGGGIDLDRLKVLANLSGLPPGAETLLTMWNRNYIDEASVDAGIREGHIKTKWAKAFKRMRWGVLGGAEYAGLWLRGWISKQEAVEGGALTGHTPEQMELLYKNRGRPMAPVQAFTAWARKAPHPVGEGLPNRPGTFDFEDFKTAIQRSDIRTEYVEPLWAIRFAYPSLFIVNRLATAGTITPDEAADWLEKQRYAPEVIAALRVSWGGGAGAVADPNVKKAQTQLWNATHTSFVKGEASEADVGARFDLLAIPAAARDSIVELWQSERDLIRQQLTPAQIKKAYLSLLTNPATGQPWTWSDAISALLNLGYTFNDAATLLEQPEKRLSASQILAAMRTGAITEEQAATQLQALGYSVADAQEIVAGRQQLLTVSQIIAAVRTRGISEADGFAQLQALGYTPEQAQELMSTRIPHLTSAQIVKAVATGTITRDQGLQRLLALGYRPEDADVLLPP